MNRCWIPLLSLLVAALSAGGCSDECPPGTNPDSLFCHGEIADAGAGDGGDPCEGLEPGEPCGPGLTCSEGGACTCGDGEVDDGESCDLGEENGPNAGCEDACVLSCESDAECPEAAGPCVADGICDLDNHRCEPGEPLPAGTDCGESRVCDGEGACVGCDGEGGSCMPENPCLTGTITCDTGAPQCVDGEPREAGTPCGDEAVCDGEGDCIGCVAGMACSSDDPCREASVDCATGAPVCVDGDLRPAGSSCGEGRVCSAEGDCVECEMGMSCAPENPCREAMVVCSSGMPVCVDGPAVAPGTSCGEDRVCAEGAECIDCEAGAGCVPDNTCFDGVIACDTGTPVCEPTTMRDERAECGEDLLCTADARCVECLEPTDCPTFEGEGIACDEPRACQGSRGERTCDAEGTCGTRSNVPDDRACTTSTLALECGLFADIYCTGEEEQTPPACPTTCTGDADCDEGAHCDGTTCIPDRDPGDPCERTVDCGGGLVCVDGVCCTSACGGLCEACNVTGFEGSCTPVPGGTDPAAECGGFSCRSYYAGFSGDQCLYRADVGADAVSCDGARACQGPAALCPLQPAAGVHVDCDDACQLPTGGTCSGTIAGTCTNVDPGVTACGVGACRREVAICTDGSPNTCTPGTPTTELCNGVDDDCNGTVDDVYAADAPPWYRDADGDGFGNPAVNTRACARPPGYVGNASDCNDGNRDIRPGRAEVCNNGVDDNCANGVDTQADGCNVCGDGFIDNAEQCDDGNVSGGDWCTPSCTVRCDSGLTGESRNVFWGTSCYWRDTSVQDDHGDAFNLCRARGGHLVILETPTERDAVYPTTVGFSGASRVYVGLRRQGASWVWDNGVPLSWGFFRGGEPSGDGSCVEWGPRNSANDISCSTNRDYVCERPRDGTPR